MLQRTFNSTVRFLLPDIQKFKIQKGICSFILCKNVYIYMKKYAQKFHEGYSKKYYKWQSLGSGTLSYLELSELRHIFITLYHILFEFLNMRHLSFLWNKRKLSYPISKLWESTFFQENKFWKWLVFTYLLVKVSQQSF